MYIYVLELENGYYYVGKTTNLHYRLQDHFGNKGCSWTKRHPPVNLIEHFQDNGFNELATTLRYMKLYGVENVRGSVYSNINLTRKQIEEIQVHFRGEDDLCLKCGNSDHFQGECQGGWWKWIIAYFRRVVPCVPTVRFGKHRGSTYEYVYDADPNYCEWVLQTESQNKDFNHFRTWLLEKR